jgi:hypothetical protein
MTTKPPRTWGLLARYDTTSEIMKACETVRDAGYTKWDACTPFPVHNLDKAMGVKPTSLPWIVLGCGLTGGTLGLAYMLWTSVVDYPLNIGGKPLASVPAFVPITFELTVLLSVFGAFFGLWYLCGLPQLFHPAFAKPSFERVTDDKFVILIEADDPKFDRSKTTELLRSTGASLVEEVED